jgi:hypothetical protein
LHQAVFVRCLFLAALSGILVASKRGRPSAVGRIGNA